MPETLDVVVRCRNEMPWAERTLAGLTGQAGVVARTLFFDCGSSDGSREAAVRAGATVVDVAPDAYVPGAVLNEGMKRTTSPVVAFVNADAIPLHPEALQKLVEPIARRTELVATYARQVPRSTADRATRADYERAFGASGARVPLRRGAFFSMAASAIRRDAWACLPFDTSLRYSEDVDWVERAMALGWRIDYVPDAVFEHSHAYSLRQHFRRRLGEGAAETLIFRLGRARWIDDFVRHVAGALARDVRAGGVSVRTTATRLAQSAGYFAGRRAAARDGFAWYP